MDYFSICQIFAASPAEPGGLPGWANCKKASANETLRAHETPAGFLRKIEIVLTISGR